MRLGENIVAVCITVSDAFAFVQLLAVTKRPEKICGNLFTFAEGARWC